MCANDPAVNGQGLPNPQNMKFVNAIQRDALRWASEQIISDGNPDIARDKITSRIEQLAKPAKHQSNAQGEQPAPKTNTL